MKKIKKREKIKKELAEKKGKTKPVLKRVETLDEDEVDEDFQEVPRKTAINKKQQLNKKKQQKMEVVNSDSESDDDSDAEEVEEATEDSEESGDEEEQIPAKKSKLDNAPTKQQKRQAIGKEQESFDELDPKAAAEALAKRNSSDLTFASLKGIVSDATLKAIADMDFTDMTEFQSKSLPPLLEGRDLACAAKLNMLR